MFCIEVMFYLMGYFGRRSTMVSSYCLWPHSVNWKGPRLRPRLGTGKPREKGEKKFKPLSKLLWQEWLLSFEVSPVIFFFLESIQTSLRHGLLFCTNRLEKRANERASEWTRSEQQFWPSLALIQLPPSILGLCANGSLYFALVMSWTEMETRLRT